MTQRYCTVEQNELFDIIKKIIQNNGRIIHVLYDLEKYLIIYEN